MHAENTFGPLDEEFDQAPRIEIRLGPRIHKTGTGSLYTALPPSIAVPCCRPTPPPDEYDRNCLLICVDQGHIQLLRCPLWVSIRPNV